jgi:hypothetical protein
MWRSLDQHLHLHPELGSSTIRDHPHLTRIGFPLSQALVRRSDRARLTRFFSKLEIESRGVPGHVALLSYLRIWVSRPRGFGEPFVRALGDDALCKMLMPVIIGLAHSWDGTVATPDGQQELTARVTLDFDEWRSSWVVEGKVTRSEVVAGTVAGHSVDVHLEPQPGRTFADLAGVPAAHGALCRSGFELRGPHSVVRARAARVICFTEDPAVGGWLSRDAMSPYEEQVIAASAELGHGLRVVLQAAAVPGWREVRQDPASPLLAGYSIYRKVRFADPERLDAALEGFPALGVSGLRPEPTARARFINGLRAARELSRDHYLAGCAPDLLLPVGAESRAVTVTLDGFSQQFRASGFPLELRRLTDLEAGPHAVAVEGETLTFHLVADDPGPDPAEGTATLHWTDSGVLTARADASLACGADVVGVDLVRPVLARRGADETLVIFSDGRCEPTAETGPPAFLREEAVQPSPYFEIDLPHSAAWLAQRRGERWTVTALSCDPPAFVPATLGTDGRQAWSRLVANGPEDDDRWMSYLAAAGVES